MKKIDRAGGRSRVLGSADDSYSDLMDRGMMGAAWTNFIKSTPAAAPEGRSGMLLN